MQRLVRDGVALAFDDAGSGAPPILLVHGWPHDHTYLAPQFAHFSERHRVVSVDLRGHGDSDKPEQTYSIQGFADNLAWQIYELGLHRRVVVGHSMGAAAVLDLAGRCGDRTSAGVLLDPSTFIRPRCVPLSSPQLPGSSDRVVA
ncbi:MAG: alpha/beta hydrolase [Chloroflexi bacterium]|nr:alpha/beta hydrolase [Chloroflexota bacterium]